MFTHLDMEIIQTTHLRIKIVKKIIHSSVLLFSSIQGFNGESQRQNFFSDVECLRPLFKRSPLKCFLSLPPFSPLPPPHRNHTNKQTNLQVLYHFRNKKIANGLFHNFYLLRSRCITTQYQMKEIINRHCKIKNKTKKTKKKNCSLSVIQLNRKN